MRSLTSRVVERRAATSGSIRRFVDSGGLVCPNAKHLGGLFGWPQLQQLADVRRAQRVLAFTIDALIFEAWHGLHEREPLGLAASRADRGCRGIHDESRFDGLGICGRISPDRRSGKARE